MDTVIDTPPKQELMCPRCQHYWHNNTCPSCGCKSFAQLLQEQIENEKKAKLEAKEKPHNAFIAAALVAGFTGGQAEFMWMWLSKRDHSHWDGRIG